MPGSDANGEQSQSPPRQETSVQGHDLPEKDLQPSNSSVDNVMQREWHLPQPRTHPETHLTMNLLPEPEIISGTSDAPDCDLWANEPDPSSYWPFMPFSSQLETLPLNFDFFNLERQILRGWGQD